MATQLGLNSIYARYGTVYQVRKKESDRFVGLKKTPSFIETLGLTFFSILRRTVSLLGKV